MTEALLPGPPPAVCGDCGHKVPTGRLYHGLGPKCARQQGLLPPRIPRPRAGHTTPNGPALFDPPTQEAPMRRFQLVRTADVTGVSGVGIVADGCQFPDGTVTVRWRGDYPSTVTWGRVEDALRVHGHAGSTQLRWIDDTDQAVAELDPTSVWVVPKQPVEPGWVTGGMVNVMTPMNEDYLSPADAREFAAEYLAAADAAEQAVAVGT